MNRRIEQTAISAVNSLFGNSRGEGATEQVNRANQTNQSRRGSPTNNSSGPQSDYQVRDTGYKRQLDAANKRHVVPATGRY